MEEDAIQAQACKFARVGNGRNDSIKIGSRGSEQYPDGGGGENGGELMMSRSSGGVVGGDVSSNRFHSWHHHSSRIIRVSRASGGKDRHSKVMTSKGLRDRRVRLSVTTAIQFYDLQDRLGYDQPSKAVEWLIKAASDAISELPSLNNTFPDDTPKQQPSDEKTEQGFETADVEVEGEGDYHQTQSQNLSLSKSACSSNSETSKGSGLSLSRSEIRVNRVKARERARERAAKEKEKESTANPHHNVNNNTISQTASFTELLTGVGITSTVPATTSPTGGDDHHEPNSLFNKTARQQWCTTTPMDYFNSGLVGNPSIRTTHNQSSGFSGQIQLGSSSSLPLQALSVSPFNVGCENHSDQLQHFSFMPEHLIPSGSSDYNLNFTRGTLQSNSSPSVLPHHHPLHRFSSALDGSNNLPFFLGAAAASTTPTMENHHHHHHHHHQFSSPGFDGRLQLCYGDVTRHSDHKGKGKN